MTDNHCPTGCGRRVADGMLMCKPCWRRVPGSLQRDVYNTWRKVEAGKGPDVTHLRKYRAARDAAIQAVTK